LGTFDSLILIKYRLSSLNRHACATLCRCRHPQGKLLETILRAAMSGSEMFAS
jgi:hypothetical protein